MAIKNKRRSCNRRKRSSNSRKRSSNIRKRSSSSRKRKISKKRKDGARVDTSNYMKIYLFLKKKFDEAKSKGWYIDIYSHKDFLNDIENIKDIKGIKNRNLLMLASEYGNYEFVEYFVKRGIDVNEIDINGNNVLFILDYSSFEAQMIFHLFLNKGINVFHKNFSGKDIFNYLNEKLSFVKDEEEVENITEILAYLISWYYSVYVFRNLIDDPEFIKNVKNILYVDPDIINSTLKIVDRHIDFLKSLITTIKPILTKKVIPPHINSDKTIEYLNEKLNCKIGKEIIELIRIPENKSELLDKFDLAIKKCEELIQILNIRKGELNKELYKIEEERAMKSAMELEEELEKEQEKKIKESVKKKAKKQKQKERKLEKENKEIINEVVNDIINKSFLDREIVIQNTIKDIVFNTVEKTMDLSERNNIINDILNDIVRRTSSIAIEEIKDTKDKKTMKEILTYTTKKAIDETNNLIINLNESDDEEEEIIKEFKKYEEQKDPVLLEKLVDIYIQEDYSFKNPERLYKNIIHKLNYINKRIYDSEHLYHDINKFLNALEEKNKFLYNQILKTKDNNFLNITKTLLQEKINFLNYQYIPFIEKINSKGEYTVLLIGLKSYINEDINYYKYLNSIRL